MAEQLYGVKGTDPLTFAVDRGAADVGSVGCLLAARTQGGASGPAGGAAIRVAIYATFSHNTEGAALRENGYCYLKSAWEEV